MLPYSYSAVFSKCMCGVWEGGAYVAQQECPVCVMLPLSAVYEQFQGFWHPFYLYIFIYFLNTIYWWYQKTIFASRQFNYVTSSELNATLFSKELFSLFCYLSLYISKASSLCLSYLAPSSPCSFSVQSKTLQSKSLLNSYYSGTYVDFILDCVLLCLSLQIHKYGSKESSLWDVGNS